MYILAVTVTIANYAAAAIYVALPVHSSAKRVTGRATRTAGVQTETTFVQQYAVPRMAPTRLDQAAVFVQNTDGRHHGAYRRLKRAWAELWLGSVSFLSCCRGRLVCGLTCQRHRPIRASGGGRGGVYRLCRPSR
jgi:hypothetical protein